MASDSAPDASSDPWTAETLADQLLSASSGLATLANLAVRGGENGTLARSCNAMQNEVVSLGLEQIAVNLHDLFQDPANKSAEASLLALIQEMKRESDAIQQQQQRLKIFLDVVTAVVGILGATADPLVVLSKINGAAQVFLPKVPPGAE